MPNWATINIETDNKELFRKYLDESGQFDFNKLIPQPDCYNPEYAPCDGMEYIAIMYYLSNRFITVPNDNELRKYYTSDLSDFKKNESLEYLRTHWKEFTSDERDNLYELGSRYVKNYEKYGYKDWWDWRIAKWGTKWNATETYYTNENPYEISFSVPWCAPGPVFEKLCENHPESVIYFETESEDGFCEKHKNCSGVLTLV